MQAQLITSQDYLDEDRVEEKQSDQDYTVYVSPVFEMDGDHYQVILDGHHSFKATRLDGVDPEIVEYDHRDHDAIAWLDREDGSVETFLETVWMGSDYRDAYTGKFIF